LLLEPVLSVLKIDALFYIQILSMIVYTTVNFLINKYYTFKK
jgi:putative flippase GtrA